VKIVVGWNEIKWLSWHIVMWPSWSKHKKPMPNMWMIKEEIPLDTLGDQKLILEIKSKIESF